MYPHKGRSTAEQNDRSEYTVVSGVNAILYVDEFALQ